MWQSNSIPNTQLYPVSFGAPWNCWGNHPNYYQTINQAEFNPYNNSRLSHEARIHNEEEEMKDKNTICETPKKNENEIKKIPESPNKNDKNHILQTPPSISFMSGYYFHNYPAYPHEHYPIYYNQSNNPFPIYPNYPNRNYLDTNNFTNYPNLNCLNPPNFPNFPNLNYPNPTNYSNYHNYYWFNQTNGFHSASFSHHSRSRSKYSLSELPYPPVYPIGTLQSNCKDQFPNTNELNPPCNVTPWAYQSRNIHPINNPLCFGIAKNEYKNSKKEFKMKNKSRELQNFKMENEDYETMQFLNSLKLNVPLFKSEEDYKKIEKDVKNKLKQILNQNVKERIIDCESQEKDQNVESTETKFLCNNNDDPEGAGDSPVGIPADGADGDKQNNKIVKT